MKLACLAGLGVCLALAATARGWYVEIGDFHTTGVYDEPDSQSNGVDREATAGTLDLFRQRVARAYALGFGGVNGFDSVEGYPDSSGPKEPGLSGDGGTLGGNYFWEPNDGFYSPGGGPPRMWYGAGQDRSLVLTPDDDMEVWPFYAFPSIGQPISGASYGNASQVWDSGACLTPALTWRDENPNTEGRLDFTQGAPVTEIATTVLSKNVRFTAHVWVRYTDGSSSPVQSVDMWDDGGTPDDPDDDVVAAGGSDTFFYFQAPEGKFIGSLNWSASADNPDDAQCPALDDLGFITFPGIGNTNNDNYVDGQDFSAQKANFGMTGGATWEMGDFNGDGMVDGQDFTLLKANFGWLVRPPIPSGVAPEPAALSLLLIGAVALLRRRR